jgi:hypothetical protein
MIFWALVNIFASYTFVDGVFVIPVGTNVVFPALALVYLSLAIWVVVECTPALIKNARSANISLALEAS